MEREREKERERGRKKEREKEREIGKHTTNSIVLLEPAD